MYGEGKNQLQKNISCEINQYNFFRLYVQSAQKLHYYWIVILFCVAASNELRKLDEIQEYGSFVYLALDLITCSPPPHPPV